MGLFDNLFGKREEQNNLVQCPRCLGKGYVDEEDIKRLKQELRWQPGTCAYCNAKGKVDPGVAKSVAADTSYLTTDLTKEERKKVLQNDTEALQRAHAFDLHVEAFIQEIRDLFFTQGMAIEKIAERILQPHLHELVKSGTYEKEKDNLVKYINKAIQSGDQRFYG
jgi:hypothetical protein